MNNAGCRNLANLVLSAAKGQTTAQHNGAVTSTSELNLVGEREFLTKETAREAFAPMLAPDAGITKVIDLVPWRSSYLGSGGLISLIGMMYQLARSRW